MASASTACTPDELTWYTALGREVPGLPCGEWVGTSRVAGFTETELPTVHRLMRRESRCQPGVHSRSDDWGLMQIHAPWLVPLCGMGIACTRADLLDPQTNLRAARYVYSVQGWRAWATY